LFFKYFIDHAKVRRAKIKAVTLKLIVAAGLLSATSLTNAAPTTGEWTAKFWNDATGKYVTTWNICIQSGGNWYISSSIPGLKGKWFSKGNDTHLQTIHSSGFQAISFDISSVNKSLMTGYHQGIDYTTGLDGYYTTSLTYKSATCESYVP